MFLLLLYLHSSPPPWPGYNVTVVGYGQRGAGKTFTVTGPAYLLAMNEEEFGLLPQAVRHVFNLMRVRYENI